MHAGRTATLLLRREAAELPVVGDEAFMLPLLLLLLLLRPQWLQRRRRPMVLRLLLVGRWSAKQQLTLRPLGILDGQARQLLLGAAAVWLGAIAAVYQLQA